MNYKKLYKRLTDPIEKFESLGDCEQTAHGPMIFIDNNAPVLAVGHLDYVDFKEPKRKKQYKNTRIYDCPQLDDRLGVWMILDVLPQAGIKCDILLTDSEEAGQSTAQYFKTTKKYNWMMEFDRQGTSTVMYDYDDNDTRQLLREYDFDVEYGAYTDICKLESLGCKAFNFGVGYHGQHTAKCYANLSETWAVFSKVQSLYHDWSDTHLPHEEYTRPSVSYYNMGGINRGYHYTEASYSKGIKTFKPLAEETNKKSSKVLKPKHQEVIETVYDYEMDEQRSLEEIAQEKYSTAFDWLEDDKKVIVRHVYHDQLFS